MRKKDNLTKGKGHGGRGGVLEGDKEKKEVDEKEEGRIEAASAKNNQVADKG